MFDTIDQPTLLLDEKTARRNLQRMMKRAAAQGVAFRPHFKTHQSAQIGEWFRQTGVQKITVSSVEMAEYFAAHGWQDILIAFSLNPRQIQRIEALAAYTRLGVLIENEEALQVLVSSPIPAVDVWIKVDVGNGRTGLNWQALVEIQELAAGVQRASHLRLAGLLTHSGHTYHAASKADVARLFREGVERLGSLRQELVKTGLHGLEISVGDTPGCSLCEDWSGIDEVRPGNFIFFDAQQAAIGACRVEDISLALACPVVAKHPQRNEVVIYGGAIHLSKDTVEVDGRLSFGLPSLAAGKKWGDPIPGGRVDRLSQEHGVLQLPSKVMDQISVGDLVFILPAHSCLTVQVTRQYQTLTGEVIHTLNEINN